VIPHGEKRTLSFCGSATYGVGVEGNLELYHNKDGRIASLHWNGPWTRNDNRFDMTNLSTDSERYRLTISPIQESGILGDVSVVVAQAVYI
jgi:Aegerolysin.